MNPSSAALSSTYTPSFEAKLNAILIEGERMKRTRYQQPSIKQRTNGVYFIRPYVDVIGVDGTAKREKKVITLDGAKSMIEAKRLRTQAMEKINDPGFIQMHKLKFDDLLNLYLEKHVRRQLRAPSQSKYEQQIKKHIRPFFGPMGLSEIKTLVIQNWLDELQDKGLSWSTRYDLRNIVSGTFERAIAWGFWTQAQGNPVKGVKVGRKTAVREKRKLTERQTIQLLGLLREDVRQLCFVALFSGLRISELLALKEKHLLFDAGEIDICERYYRGDTDKTKTDKSTRRVPMGKLMLPILRTLCLGDPDAYVFNITSTPKWGYAAKRITRDDKCLRRYHLIPAAQELGVYTKGFGFHALRREAVTEMSRTVGISQAMTLAGHSSVDVSLLYTLQDNTELDAAVSNYQHRIMG